MNTSIGPGGYIFSKKKKNQFINMKKGGAMMATQHSGGNFSDLKIENSKHQTFNSDFEDNVATSVASKNVGKIVKN